jgi:hypothetical protein
MPANLPYLASPGSIKTAFERIKAAATPERVTGDFVATKLQIKGGTGKQIPPFLKKIGLVSSDGTPSELYGKFRNQQTSKAAIAAAMKIGYRELFDANEYCYELKDGDLLSLIHQVTGAGADSSSAKQTLYTFKNLNSYADFEASISAPGSEALQQFESLKHEPLDDNSIRYQKVGLNLSYTINLNLPATSDQAVFNAIFRSLREHLLSNE